MGYSKYVGRVGALAVALGVGCAVASPGGIAWADSEESSSTSSATGTAADTGSPTNTQPSEGVEPTGPEPADAGSADSDTSASLDADAENSEESSPTAQTVEVAPGVVVSSSGGAQLSDDDEQGDEANDGADSDDRSASGNDSDSDSAEKATVESAKPESNVQARTVQVDKTARVSEEKPAAASTTETANEIRQSLTASVYATTAVTPPRPTPVTAILDTVVAPFLSRIFAAIPGGPIQNPLGWILLAAARRQVGATEEPTEAVRALSAEPVLMAATVVTNAPPTVSSVFGTPSPVTGAVTGQVIGTDPEGASLTYQVTTGPSAGQLVFDSATAKFTYTPTTAQRITAAVTPTTTDTIAMTVTVSDGTNSVPAVVNIPVSAAPITNLAEIGAVNDAHAVVTAGNRAYVTNRTQGTITVIDTDTNTVIGTMPAGSTPDQLVVKPDGKVLYVTSRANNTVTVVNTATGSVVKTIQTAAPNAVAINASGTMVYVTNADAGTMTKISTWSNSISGTVKLPTGVRPTDIVVSPDKTRIYIAGTNASGQASVTLVGYVSSTSSTFTKLPSAATGLAVSSDNKKLYVSSADGAVRVIDTTTKAIVATHTVGGALAGITVSKDGSVLLATDTVGRVTALNAATGVVLNSIATRSSTTAMSVAPETAASTDGTRLYVTDFDADKVYVVSLVPANSPPKVGTPTIGTPSSWSGTVTGTLGVTDPDGDLLTYTVTPSTKGKFVVNSDGTFTYTPTSTARHAASAVDAPASATTDTIAVSVTDGKNPAVTTTVTIDILPANKIPVPKLVVGTPSTTTGVVKGSVTATDGDWDVRTYTVTTSPIKGSIVVTSTGAFTYTPTAEARHAAAKLGAPAAAKTDTFTITVDDGHGGVVPVSVTVAVAPANALPGSPTLTNSSTNVVTGVVTGTMAATDADNDTLAYTATAASKGTFTMQSNGSFTYTPTEAAREAVIAPDATPATMADTVTVTVSDGYGGTATTTLTLTIAPPVVGNVAPTNGQATVNNPTSAIGQVTGTITAYDANGDTLTYTLNGAPTKGLVKIDAATGAFAYVPNVEARYAAAATAGVDTDVFTVTISDGNGGFSTATVQVSIAPPAASTIDQRSTTVAIAAPDMYFYSQSELDVAFAQMKAVGINSVRVMLPWAGIEPINNQWRWTEADRLINTANANGFEVLAVLNSTPVWAGILVSSRPDTAEYAEFAGVLATRYAGKIAAYEIWNEANAFQFWAPAPSAAQYTELLKAAYPVIKAADPDAVVVAAGLAPLVDFFTLTINPVRFVEEMYAAGAAGYFDALAYHPYLYGKMYTQADSWNQNTPANQANRIYQLMVANGDGNKKIWATEYGQPTSYAGETSQAEYLGDFLRAWRDLEYAGPAFIHTLRDYPHKDADQASFGLFNQDWTPKLAIATVEDVVEENQAMLDQG